MKYDELNIDKAFREKLNAFSEPPPAHIWGNIQGQLATPKKKKRLVLLPWISAAAVLVFALLAGWYFIGQTHKEILPVAENQTKLTEQQQTPIESTQRDNIAHNQDDIFNKSANNEPAIIRINNNAPKEYLVAENKKDQFLATNTTAYNKVKRNSLKKLDRIGAFFTTSFENQKLMSYNYKNPDSGIDNSEHKRIAENIRSISKNNKDATGWKMGMHISPGYASHQASHSKSYAENMTYSDAGGSGNLGGGFSIQFKTGKKVRVESGVYYAQNGQKSRNSSELFAFNGSADYAFASAEKSYFNTSVNVANGKMAMNSTAGIIEFSGVPESVEIVGTPDGNRNSLVSTDLAMIGAPKNDLQYSNTLLTNGEFTQVFDFIEIPIYLRYSLVNRKFDIEIMGGINAGIIVGNKVFMDDGSGLQNVGKTQDITSLNYSGTLGFGVTYAMGKNLSVAVEPRLNYYLNSINNNPSVDFRPYRVGVYTGLYYEF